MPIPYLLTLSEKSLSKPILLMVTVLVLLNSSLFHFGWSHKPSHYWWRHYYAQFVRHYRRFHCWWFPSTIGVKANTWTGNVTKDRLIAPANNVLSIKAQNIKRNEMMSYHSLQKRDTPPLKRFESHVYQREYKLNKYADIQCGRISRVIYFAIKILVCVF